MYPIFFGNRQKWVKSHVWRRRYSGERFPSSRTRDERHTRRPWKRFPFAGTGTLCWTTSKPFLGSSLSLSVGVVCDYVIAFLLAYKMEGEWERKREGERERERERERESVCVCVCVPFPVHICRVTQLCGLFPFCQLRPLDKSIVSWPAGPFAVKTTQRSWERRAKVQKEEEEEKKRRLLQLKRTPRRREEESFPVC